MLSTAISELIKASSRRYTTVVGPGDQVYLAKPFTQLRPPPPRSASLDRNSECLPLPNQGRRGACRA
jgi:hypothetical protein